MPVVQFCNDSFPQKLPKRPLHKLGCVPKNKDIPIRSTKEFFTDMKATGIVRRIDDLGRVVIPKEIRRVLRIREGDPSLMTLANWQRFCFGMFDLAKRQGWK